MLQEENEMPLDGGGKLVKKGKSEFIALASLSLGSYLIFTSFLYYTSNNNSVLIGRLVMFAILGVLWRLTYSKVLIARKFLVAWYVISAFMIISRAHKNNLPI